MLIKSSNDENEIGIDIDNFDIEAEIKKWENEVETLLWRMLVRLYVTTNKTSGGIILTPQTQDDNQYESCVGLVVQKGPFCYQDSRFTINNELIEACNVGDWIIFPRHAGRQVHIKGIPFFFLMDDGPLAKIRDPRNVTK